MWTDAFYQVRYVIEIDIRIIVSKSYRVHVFINTLIKALSEYIFTERGVYKVLQPIQQLQPATPGDPFSFSISELGSFRC